MMGALFSVQKHMIDYKFMESIFGLMRCRRVICEWKLKCSERTRRAEPNLLSATASRKSVVSPDAKSRASTPLKQATSASASPSSSSSSLSFTDALRGLTSREEHDEWSSNAPCIIAWAQDFSNALMCKLSLYFYHQLKGQADILGESIDHQLDKADEHYPNR
jgi:hypothetical protein